MENKITLENFDALISSQTRPYAIRFSSKTCGPCNTMIPVVEKVRSENPGFNFFEIDTDEEPELSSHFGIRSVPTIHICEQREILFSFHGITPFRDIHFVINNLNDPYFKEHGHFKANSDKKNYTFEIAVVSLVILFTLLFIFIKN